MDTLERNREAFSGQSKGFSSEGDTYADSEGLAWMLKELPLSPEATVLDIATGLSISLGTGETPGLVGTAIIKDRVTDVLDLGDVLKSVAGRTVESEVL